nr:ribonuclease H-like domain-containing protein [Tanacetum cinerariifolium]
DPATGALNMDTCASSYLNDSVTSLSDVFNTCIYPSVSIIEFYPPTISSLAATTSSSVLLYVSSCGFDSGNQGFSLIILLSGIGKRERLARISLLLVLFS